MTFKGEGYCV